MEIKNKISVSGGIYSAVISCYGVSAGKNQKCENLKNAE
jgi:hypothetical protein